MELRHYGPLTMSWISEKKELAGALRVDVRLLLHEELQRQAMRAIYLHPKLRAMTLHGGTALRMVHGSPRFSLDLDFTGRPSLDLRDVPEELMGSIKPFERLMSFEVKLAMKKILSNKSDFLRFNLNFELAQLAFKVKVELLQREFRRGIRREIHIELPVPTVVYVKTKEISDILVDKICAIAGRSYALPRNIYDVDFIVRNGGKLNAKNLKEEFGEWRETKGGLRRARALLEKADHGSIQREINMLLPQGAKVDLEGAGRCVRATLEALNEAARDLNG